MTLNPKLVGTFRTTTTCKSRTLGIGEEVVDKRKKIRTKRSTPDNRGFATPRHNPPRPGRNFLKTHPKRSTPDPRGSTTPRRTHRPLGKITMIHRFAFPTEGVHRSIVSCCWSNPTTRVDTHVLVGLPPPPPRRCEPILAAPRKDSILIDPLQLQDDP
ncbi:hypothetical protein PHJA_002726900 [Phtheirospermum japonicum]|uniref:Uncharacterized protein n=1 Tax=Phtheirospermum japonicum TaxID=374723 RepID=A0A830CZG8_9LAMI|nr:hypothetical protein PHJA_002726900 [Phtheirospermum japonicum]